MNKLLKNVNKRSFLTVLIMIVLMLTTFVAYKVYAVEVTDEMRSDGPGMANGQVGARDYLTVNDLYYRYEIFCCSKGTPLNGAGRATLVTEEGSSDPGFTGKLKPGDEGTKLFEVNKEGEDTQTPFVQGTYTNKTYGEYEVKEVKIATPMEAYILAEMLNNLPNQTNAGFKFVGDDTGHREEYTGDVSSASYMVIGDKTVYIIENEGAGSEGLVMQDSDGKYYYVEEDSDQGLGIYSYVQRAWWNTDACTSSSNAVPANGLTLEAKAFEDYIAQIAKSMNTADFVDTEFEINGVKGTVKAPELEYKPEYNDNESYKLVKNSSDYDLDNVTVKWDSDEGIYKVGPFSVNYVEAGAHVEGRSAVQFAGITDANLFTDASEDALKLGTDWKFIWLDGEREVDDEYEYPHANEVFYIGLNDIENATKITNLSFDFRYMNAGAQFENLVGTYYELTWEAKEQDNWCYDGHTCSHGFKSAHTWTTGSGDTLQSHSCSGGTPCEHGYYKPHVESTDYWVELTSFSSPKESQQLAGGLIGARWYNTEHIDRELDLRYGKIKITKELVDEDGNTIKPEDKVYFDFKITVDGAINSGSEKIRVRAGSSAETKAYYWKESEGTPTYKVEEIPKDGYKLYDIENDEGSLETYKTVTVKAKNQKVHEGTLQIDKEIEESILNGESKIVDGTFKFRVTLSGDFKYEGKTYRNESTTFDVDLTTQGGKASWSSSTVKWYGEKAPKYNVEELKVDGFELVSINRDSGRLTENGNANVIVKAKNKVEIEKAKIHIIKTLENADLYDEDEIMALKFKFKIHVDKYNDEIVELSAKRIDNTYVWEHTTGYYEWLYGENPNYTIEEIELPEGTEFVNAEAQGATVSGMTLSGKLEKGDEAKDFAIDNKFINKIEIAHHGKIHITKQVDADRLKNKNYLFAVTLTGAKFTYQGNTYTSDQIVQITNDKSAIVLPGTDYDNTNLVVVQVGDTSGDWTSDEITWYGEKAPQFNVEENAAGENVDISVVPNSGYLSDTETEMVEVIAKNHGTGQKHGYLHIIKTLEDAENASVDYINSLVFKFKIEVDGYEPTIVSLKPERKDNSYIWEYTSPDPYIWAETEEAPHYKITEIDVPEGTEFVSANGGTSTTVEGTLKETEMTDHLVTTDNEFVNKVQKKTGDISIDKKVTHGSLNGKEFEFNVTIKGTFEYNGTPCQEQEVKETVKVSGGSVWTSGTITWYGKDAPTYIVEEKESDIANNISVINAAGTVQEGTKVTVATFINEPKLTGGYLQITKNIDSNENESAFLDKEFRFQVTIAGESFEIRLKPGETYKSDYYTWYATEEAPTYSIEELADPQVENCDITPSSGTLLPNGETIEVIAVNHIKSHEGRFSVKKEIIADEKLLDGLDLPSFTITMKISGTFVMDGETIVNGTKTITTSLKPNETYNSSTIKWWGDQAPVVDVTESNLPLGWKNIGISNNGAQLSEGEDTEIIVTNRLATLTIIDLTMQLAGDVWEEDVDENDKNTENSVVNGLMDEAERGVGGVEVFVYKNDGSLAVIYDENGTEMTQPVITADSGHWNVPGVKMLKGDTYDIEFVYDGQTYEPTKALVTGDAGSYKAASTSGRDAWAKDSMALDIDRDEVNNRIQTVTGKTAIDGNGDTVGTASGANGDSTLIYKGIYNSGTNRIASELQTTDANGVAYDLFKTKARTSAVGLTYPFDSKIHLESYDTYINELGLVQYYKYSATYNYTLHINLGLVERNKVDIEAVKDLVSAKAVVNDRLLEYKFNTLADFGKDILTRRSEIDSYGIKYELGLYSTDYYYRADLYRTGLDSTAYDKIESFYKTYYQSLDETELEVYLKYKISLYNQSSQIYTVKINSVDDYFDSSFGAPIQTDIQKYVKSADGSEKVVTVAEQSNASWTVVEKNIVGSDGVTYNKMRAENLGISLNSGESADIFVTFAVKKSTVDGVQQAIELGEKSNVVEISSYSTYNQDGSVAGKVDKDSAPENINVRDYNQKSYYDDDTDAAPVLNLTLLDSDRVVNGIAWEDNSNDGTVGIHDDDEALIAGLTTELVEKIKVKTAENEYTEYDFLWPTHEPLNALGGKSMEHLTGFDSTIETSYENNEETGKVVGGYSFIGVPTGNYVVRFLYGNDKTKLEDTYGVTLDGPKALKADGTSYSGNENILIANYDNDKEGATPAIYNGQDFKATIYQLNFANIDENGYIKNEWHDLKNQELAEAKVSDSRDNEARRLEVIANSETMTNTNGKVLISANDVNAKHTGLFDYYMFTDTAKLNLEVLKDAEGATKEVINGTVYMNGSVSVEEETTEYNISKIDCGLVERPENNVVLDKQISDIKLTTNDNKVIFDAKYDISYELVSDSILGDGISNKTVIAKFDDKYLVAKVELNEASISTDLMQAINKQENKLPLDTEVNNGLQNFRYINIDDSILQGLTIELDYLLTALNVGETDYTTETLENMYETARANKVSVKDEIISLAKKVHEENVKSTTTNSVVKLGEYLGTNYYTGNVGSDKVVTTRIRQVVDYVDNDAIFATTDNTAKDHSWKNTTLTELTGNGYEVDRLLDEVVTQQDRIIDKNGVSYTTEQRNNLILSVDNPEDGQELSNAGFETKLTPYEVDQNPETYTSSIELKVTKTIGVNTDDAENLTFDNIAEVVKYENSVGRRDIITTPGNANPQLGEFSVAFEERDSSATELVTFTPPTGLEVEKGMTLQILLVVLISLLVVVVGIMIIKKKVLEK